MLIALANLVDRARHVPGRAADLRELRERFSSVCAPTAELGAAALRMRALRTRISDEIGSIDACGKCTRGCPAPQGIYDGGHCCSGATADVFNADEVAALALAGTRMRHLRTPREQLAGCAFRGPRGCTVAPADRPNVCTLYLCRDLRRELFDRGRLDRIEGLVDELGRTYERFVADHDEHTTSAELAAIHPALPTAGTSASPLRAESLERINAHGGGTRP